MLERLYTVLRRRTRPLAAAVLAWLLTACGGGVPQTIDRDLFIDTYVDLRMAALDADSAKLSDADRGEILTRHGVTEEDLLSFAEIHAAELEFMREVWNDVELRLDRTAAGN